MLSPHELVGTQVWRTSFDYQVRLLLVAHPRLNAELVVEVPFRLCDSAGVWHLVTPGEPATLGPVLDLFQKSIDSVQVTDEETLTIGFGGGWCLEASPAAEFESWSVVEL
jgi:hypothetical protein